ncbi:MAG: protein kinase [Anaerolineae bacterium]|nr:protein kinase [Anaerolineae bacterium]
MTDLSGQTIGQYRVIEQIGVGSMAAVYRAHQPSIDRVVAIKVLLGEYTRQRDFLERFKREARATGALRHIHVLPIYDYGEFTGVPYLVVPFIESGTLADRLRACADHQLELDEVLRLGGQVASALDHAHSRGVIHRDVKPSNVLIDNDGNALLGDFGLAKLVEADSTNITGTGMMVGTPDYMSPEQCSGLPVDVRTDVYSLAVMLYEMLIGRVPFKGDSPVETVLMHIEGPIPDAPDHPAFDAIFKKGLAKDPSQRYSSAGEMMAAFYEASGSSPTAAYAPVAQYVDRLHHATAPMSAVEDGEVAALSTDEAPTLLGSFYLPMVAEATRLNHGYLGVEHLFISMARSPKGVLASALRQHRLSAEEMIQYVSDSVGRGDGALFPSGPRPTPRLMRIIGAAVALARREGRDTLAERDLCAALLGEGESFPVRALVRSGAALEAMLEQVQRAPLSRTALETQGAPVRPPASIPRQRDDV